MAKPKTDPKTDASPKTLNERLAAATTDMSKRP